VEPGRLPGGERLACFDFAGYLIYVLVFAAGKENAKILADSKGFPLFCVKMVVWRVGSTLDNIYFLLYICHSFVAPWGIIHPEKLLT